MSDSECSSYQSGDPRKYEFPTGSPTRDAKKVDLDFTLDIVMEVSSPRSNADQFYGIIQELRREKKKLEHTIWDKNAQAMNWEYTKREFITRISHLEFEVKRLEEEKEKQIAPKPTLPLVLGVLRGIVVSIVFRFRVRMAFQWTVEMSKALMKILQDMRKDVEETGLYNWEDARQQIVHPFLHPTLLHIGGRNATNTGASEFVAWTLNSAMLGMNIGQAEPWIHSWVQY